MEHFSCFCRPFSKQPWLFWCCKSALSGNLGLLSGWCQPPTSTPEISLQLHFWPLICIHIFWVTTKSALACCVMCPCITQCNLNPKQSSCQGYTVWLQVQRCHRCVGDAGKLAVLVNILRPQAKHNKLWQFFPSSNKEHSKQGCVVSTGFAFVRAKRWLQAWLWTFWGKRCSYRTAAQLKTWILRFEAGQFPRRLTGADWIVVYVVCC